MIKKHYLKELSTTVDFVKYNMVDHNVKKVQEWLNLWKRYDTGWKISTGIDSHFGNSTLATIKEFQSYCNLESDGIVGNKTWAKLTEPMRKAFTKVTTGGSTKDLIIAYAKQQLQSAPREFNQNEGTWVRAYMDGYEGRQWPWCMGFVQTVVDQATTTVGESLKDYMPHTYSCDVVGEHGLRTNRLLRNKEIGKAEETIAPGDIFLNVKSPHDWSHTGIITEVSGDWITTIEGNTNDEGSREGYEVCERKRNVKTKNIDIFRI